MADALARDCLSFTPRLYDTSTSAAAALPSSLISCASMESQLGGHFIGNC